MKDTRRLALAALVLGLAACVMAGASWREARRNLAATGGSALRQTGETSQTSLGAAPAASPEWLNGTTDERFGRVERHLRGMDQAMAEIGYRYGELLVAGRERNWDYAKYQAEKIDLSLRLALERRPKRAQSSQAFLNDLPAVVRAIQNQNGQQLDSAMERLHNSCVACHRSENVLYFRGAVERIRSNALRQVSESQ
jgi:hypothetical protein